MSIARIGRTVVQSAAWLVAAGALVAAVTPRAAAQPAPLDRRVSVNLDHVRPADAFRTLAELAGSTAAVDAAVADPITVRLENVRIRTVLDAVCESVGCRWEMAGSPPALRVTSLPDHAPKPEPARVLPSDRVDLKVAGADCRELLRTIANLLDAELVLDPAVAGKVTVDAAGKPLQQVLDSLCRQAHCAWSLAGGDGGGRRTLKVAATRP